MPSCLLLLTMHTYKVPEDTTPTASSFSPYDAHDTHEYLLHSLCNSQGRGPRKAIPEQPSEHLETTDAGGMPMSRTTHPSAPNTVHLSHFVTLLGKVVIEHGHHDREDWVLGMAFRKLPAVERSSVRLDNQRDLQIWFSEIACLGTSMRVCELSRVPEPLWRELQSSIPRAILTRLPH
ncbi:hypothetical protein OPT61_g9656 [Boeremia exigua]|uniref:Uncharacterized protein n=1 Tax=Boeremia exigua TaxID=749465 RepID=A0ACC2HT54_9PLEO|nr:hypothetical protein OPT61_g9656 [Boeremia exigua]